ncbi:MAG: ATP-binding protein [Firmicutes bacterium HGW-Firmicutes-9]|jgi:molecular chaperone HtpG|nr:MAG: ATP-binding protein [Firmicutes bacterium HGW-Firmicutes-9]
MADYVFGANILENLTTGMYQDSKVIYREYIQNACDQIDKAIKDGILKLGEGTIDIWLDRTKRTIVIEDNATGIPAGKFQEVLGNIADSDKKIGEDKGFRGIGRLCGLAYCKELVFISSSKGETVESTMRCDAKKMRALIDENGHGKKHTADDVLHAINSFDLREDVEAGSHYFRVEMVDISPENTDLLDFQQVKDYLSFVAPVPYQSSFIYRKEIYNHAKCLSVKIDEYNVKINAEQVFKKYVTILKDSQTGDKYDDIFGIEFKDFYLDDELIAWMWVGVSRFQKAIPKVNQMRGLRLRKENIQIGDEDSLQKLFREDRGNTYFVGEVFAINRDLIPNSQRSYFNENPARLEFERTLRKYFNEELRKIYYNGSTINAAYKKIDAAEKKEAEFKQKESAGVFVDDDHRERELEVVLEAKKEAETAQEKIEKVKEKADGLMQKVIQRIEVERPRRSVAVVKPVTVIPVDNNDPKQPRSIRRVDKLTHYSKAERKLISKIFSIITTATDSQTSEMIIRKIEEGL